MKVSEQIRQAADTPNEEMESLRRWMDSEGMVLLPQFDPKNVVKAENLVNQIIKLYQRGQGFREKEQGVQRKWSKAKDKLEALGVKYDTEWGDLMS